MYYRSDDRQAPHNVFTNYDMLQAGIEAYGYETAYDPAYEDIISSSRWENG